MSTIDLEYVYISDYAFIPFEYQSSYLEKIKSEMKEHFIYKTEKGIANVVYQKCQFNNMQLLNDIMDYYIAQPHMREYFFLNLFKIMTKTAKSYKEKMQEYKYKEDNKEDYEICYYIQGYIYQLLYFVKNTFRDVNSVREFYHNIPQPDKDFTPLSFSQTKYYSSTIFTSYSAEEWFYDIIPKPDQRGFQAMINAIFRNEDCKKYIFKPHIKLKDYVKFINNKYGKTFNPDKLSDPKKYEHTVENLIKEYTRGL